jgi:hypothetical protein
MSSISGISSVASAANPYRTNAIQNSQRQRQTVTDFQAIGNAIQSGNVTTAQTALAAFQHDLPAAAQSPAIQPFGKNVQANADFQTLTGALKTGDMTGAQKAFTALQTDLKIVYSTPHAATAASTASSASSTVGSAFENIISKISNILP